MPMVACPSCGSVFNALPEQLGLQFQCPSCSQTFIAQPAGTPQGPAPGQSAAQPAPAAQPVQQSFQADPPPMTRQPGAQPDPHDQSGGLGPNPYDSFNPGQAYVSPSPNVPPGFPNAYPPPPVAAMPGPPQGGWTAGAAGGQSSILTKPVQTLALSILGLVIAAILLIGAIDSLIEYFKEPDGPGGFMSLTMFIFMTIFFYGIVWSVSAINILKTIANNQLTHNK